MKYILSFLLFFSLSFSIGQVKEIIVKSSLNNLGITNVLIYSENRLIGNTDDFGRLKIDLSNLKSIQLVKEDFYDLSLSRDEVSEVIFLDYIKVIELDEVVINKLNNKQILDKVEFNLTKNQQIYATSSTIQYYNILKTGKDTLHYLNNRLIWKMNDGRYINYQNKIIKNFYEINNTLTYEIGEKKISFWTPFNSRMRSIYFQNDLPAILKNKVNYNFEIVSDSSYYKITFKNKKKAKFSYEGYLIVDKEDFGIYELQMSLVSNKSNQYSCIIFDEKTQQSYSVFEEKLSYSFFKNDNKYELLTSKYDMTFSQTKGNFKGQKFSNIYRIESTPNFVDSKAIKFDLNNYEKL